MNFLRLFQSELPTTVLGGRYKVLKQLGAGGFGQTFLAEDLHLPGNPHCVIKRLQPQFSDPTSLQTAKRLFDTEAQVLYALGNHDRIPKLLAHFEQDEQFYLAQELIVGHSLGCEVRDGTVWREAQVVGLLRDILEVLAFVHQQQVIHRDIKPANLIRRHADRKIVLIDFGAVKQATTQLLNSTGQSGLTISIGTPGYMPNEQLAGNPRFSSDVFAVGMIGIHALTGISPRSLPKNLHTSEIEWQDQVAAVHPELAAVLDKMVCYDFRVRYATAAEALAAIEQVPIKPEPPPLRYGLTTSEDCETSLSQIESTIPAPTDQTRSTTIEELPSTARLSQNVTPPIHLIPTAAPTQAKAFFRQPKSIGLLAAGLAGLILLVSSLRPDGDAPATVNTAGTTASANAPLAALLMQANQLRNQKQFQQAVQVYDRAIALDPNSPEAYWGRCYSLNLLKQFDRAIDACDSALKLNPNYAEALWSRGFALDQKGQDQDALKLFEQAIAKKPDFAEAWVNKGATLTQLNRSKEAIAAFEKAIELDANLPEAWSNRGRALWNLQQFDQAIDSVDRAIELQPDNAEVLRLRQQMQERLDK